MFYANNSQERSINIDIQVHRVTYQLIRLSEINKNHNSIQTTIFEHYIIFFINMCFKIHIFILRKSAYLFY